MRKRVRFTENDLHRVIKESVKRVLKEAHVIDQQFGMNNSPGSFEAALVNAWKAAGESNKRKLEQAFPEIFPSSAMYGNENEPFDFREFPTRKHYDDFMTGWNERNTKQ
jgi:hypothetical protein